MKIAAILLVLVLILAIDANGEEHRFWDRKQFVGLGIHVGARILDVHSTCRFLARGTATEKILPTQDCEVVAWISAGMIGVQIFTSWIFHHRGRHRWERWTPYAFAVPTGIVAGLNYRF